MKVDCALFTILPRTLPNLATNIFVIALYIYTTVQQALGLKSDSPDGCYTFGTTVSVVELNRIICLFLYFPPIQTKD